MGTIIYSSNRKQTTLNQIFTIKLKKEGHLFYVNEVMLVKVNSQGELIVFRRHLLTSPMYYIYVYFRAPTYVLSIITFTHGE